MRNLQVAMTAILVGTVLLASGCTKGGGGAADGPPLSLPSSAPIEPEQRASSADVRPTPSPPSVPDDSTPAKEEPDERTKPQPATGPPPADMQIAWAKAATSATVRRLRRGEAGYEPSGAAKAMPAAWARQMTALLEGVLARREAGSPAKRCRFDPGIAVSLEQPNGPTAYAELCFTCGDVRFGEHTLDFLPDAGRFKALVRKAFPTGGLEPVESNTGQSNPE